MSRSLSRFFALALVSLVASCGSQGDFESTVPANGQKNVPTRSIIAVRLSTSMSAPDIENNIDPRHFTVRGDQSSALYTGSVGTADFRDIVSPQTVEEYREAAALRDAEPLAEGEEEAEDFLDTLVFLLDDGIQFRQGEVITVRLSNSIKVRSATVDKERVFKFVVTGGASTAEGELFVTSATPLGESADVSLSPTVAANFSVGARLETLANGITVRGSVSGVHDGPTLFSQSGTTTRSVSRRLEPGDAFVPGEQVDVTWDQTILSQTNVPLSPYLLSFQVRPGHVLSENAWNPQRIATTGSPAVAILPGEFDPEVAGAEFAVVFQDRIELFKRLAVGNAWSSQQLELDLTGRVRGAVAVDSDDDGTHEIWVISDGHGDRGEISLYALDASGVLEDKEDVVEFPAKAIAAIHLADLNSDGSPELIVTHGEVTFVPEVDEGLIPGGVPLPDPEPEQTGLITFFELRAGAPPGGIDLNDLEALERRRFTRIGRPIDKFEPATRVEARDLDGDGRLDLVAQLADRLVLYRNQSTVANSFEFRRIGPVFDAGGSVFSPRAWVLGDLDHDRDVDLLAWKGTSVLFFENRQPPRGTPASEPSGLLFEIVVPERLELPFAIDPGDRVIATNLDGDVAGFADIVRLGADGGIELAIARPGFRLQFTMSDLFFGTEGASAAAIADINGDTGLDVVAASNSSIRATLSDEQFIEAVVPPTPSAYELVPIDELRGENGFGDLDAISDAANEVTLVVAGRIASEYTGYSIAVDYDESRLDYIGFVSPSSIKNRATFALCPTMPALLGCSGFATVRMTFQRDVVGSVVQDRDGNPVPAFLGALRFRLRTVSEPDETEVFFSTITSGETVFGNAVAAVEGTFSQEIPVTELGENIVIVLSPPPPPEKDLLAVECAVIEQSSQSFAGEVAWSSPRGEAFDNVFVSIGGVPAPENPIPWNDRRFPFTRDIGGAVDVTVTIAGVAPGPNPEDAVSRTCRLVSVFQPAVDCVRREASNLISWTLLDHPTVDLFRVYRNGVRVTSILGSSGEDGRYSHVDTSPALGANRYEVSGVISGVEGPRGVCLVEDTEPCDTLAPKLPSAVIVNRTSSSSPNLLRFRWENGEGYDRLEGVLQFVPEFAGDPIQIIPALGPGDTEFVYSGDPDRGGAAPGRYTFELTGFVTAPDSNAQCGGLEVASRLVQFQPLVVRVPSLDEIGFACSRSGLADIFVSWNPLWRGFDRFTTIRVVRDGIVVVEDADSVLISDTSVTISELSGLPLEPIGSYTVSLAARHAGQTFSVSCGPISFDPEMVVGDVEAGLGLADFEIPITAIGIFSVLDGFSFDLEFPDFVTIAGFTARAAGTGRSRITVTRSGLAIDPDPDGDRSSDGVVDLIRLRASIASSVDIGRSGEALTLHSANIDFASSAVARPVDVSNGRLLIAERFIVLDRARVAAGSDEPVRIAVRGTFAAPPGVDDYKFGAFQLHLKFDPELLELLPVTIADQRTTAVGTQGFWVLPDEPRLVAPANQTGEFNVVWVGFNNDQLLFLEPIADKEIAVMRFRSRLGVDDPEVFASIEFVTDPSATNPTAFFPHRDVLGVPDMEAFLPGGILIESDAIDFGVAGLEPSRGALAGGTTVHIFGRGFPAVPGAVQSLTLTAATQNGPHVLTVDPGTVELTSARELRFATPDTGLRAARFTGTRFYDLDLRTNAGSALLRRAFLYESPEIQSTDVTSVRAGSSDLVRVSGRGLSTSAEAFFLVDGQEFPVEIFRHDPFGLELIVLATGLPSPPAGAVLIGRLGIRNLPDPISILAPVPIQILAPSGEPSLDVLAVSPDDASRCGGDRIVITGTGFTPNTRVDFGGTPPASFTYVNASRIEVVVPVFEAASNLMLNVRESGLVVALPFEITDPPPFIRGDIDGTLNVDVTDASLLAGIVVGSIPVPQSLANADALDVNDDGVVDFGDSVYLFNYLFDGGSAPPPPFLSEGQDPTADGICQ